MVHPAHCRLRRLSVEPLEDRLTPTAGQLDPTFGTGGIETVGSTALFQLATVPDGRILAMMPSSVQTDLYLLARFESNGTPDSTFGNGGIVSLPQLPFDLGSFAAEPDGGAVIVGDAYDASQADYEFGLIRVTATGAVDPTFGNAGTAVVSFDTPTIATIDRPEAVAIQPDGRILVVGSATQPSTLDGEFISTGEMAVARLTGDGRLDPTFGTDGLTTFQSRSIGST